MRGGANLLTTGGLATVAVMATAIAPAAVRAQDGPEASVSTIVLRDTVEVDRDVADAIDGELLRSLAEVAGVDDATVSPVSLEELSTAAGCADRDEACLQAIAEHLEAEAVLLRRLETADGSLRLTLIYDDPHISDDAPRVQRELNAGTDLAVSIDGAVRALFGIPEPPTEAEQAAEPSEPEEVQTAVVASPPHRARSLSVGTVVVLGAGGLILVGGGVAGVMSMLSQADYEDASVTTRAEADQALDDLEAAQSQATVANVLFMVGAAVTLTGAVLLALDLGVAAENGDHVNVSVGATPTAAMLTLEGRL